MASSLSHLLHLNLLADHRQQLEKLAKDVAEKKAKEEFVSVKEKRKSRADWLRFWLGLLLGWLLGALSPVDLWGWVVCLFGR